MTPLQPTDADRPTSTRRPVARTDLAGRTVALAHDYLTQRGGAERVALLMAQAFPGSPLHTTLYHPDGTFPEFRSVPVRTGGLDRVGALRRNHRFALPLLAPEVSRHRIDADVVLASSTGWAHGYRTDGRMVVYCHAPARWLYQRDRYLGTHNAAGHSGSATAERVALGVIGPTLRRWDARAAGRADRYLANSSVTALAINEVYGRTAEVLPPPPAVVPGGPEEPVAGLRPGFLLSVARLMPYKNIDLVIEATRLSGLELVVVGHGPERDRLAALSADLPGVHLLHHVSDASLRWLYRNASALVAASFEDFGLSPLEANAFGRPVVALHAGGYLDTVIDGETGIFFDELSPVGIARAVDVASRTPWSSQALTARAADFGSARFVCRLREVAAEEAAR